MEKGKDFTLEEKHKRVKEFRPIDDAFCEVLANDIDFCQEMLRILLDDEKLIVEDVIVQSSERNIYGRSVRLDALCFLKRYGKCNVEVQRSGSDEYDLMRQALRSRIHRQNRDLKILKILLLFIYQSLTFLKEIE